jgi:hypothetical protein
MLHRVLLPEDGVLQPGGAGHLLSPAGGPGLLDITATISRESGLLGTASYSDTAEVKLVLDVRLEPATLTILELDAGRAEAMGYFALLEPAGQVATLPPSAMAQIALSLEARTPGLLEVVPGPSSTHFLVTGPALGLASLTARCRANLAV